MISGLATPLIKFLCYGVCWTLDAHNSMKIRKNPGSTLLGLWIFLQANKKIPIYLLTACLAPVLT